MKIFRFVAPLLLALCFVSTAAAQGLLQKAQQAGAGQSATPQEGLIRAGAHLLAQSRRLGPANSN